MIEQIRRWTDRPVRWLINTHWHPDHNAGNGSFLRAFPGLEIISTAATRDDIVELLPKKEVTPAQIEGFLADTRRGTDAAGKPFSEAARRYRARVAAELDGFGPELRAAEHTAPNATFTDERVIDVGHRIVRVAFLGRGNTAGDAIVQVPDARLVATGDLVVHPVPYPFGSFIGEWIATLGRLRAIDAAIWLPGHGPVLRDPGYLDLTIELLRETQAQVAAAVAAGKSFDDALAGIRLDALRARFVGDSPDRAAFFDSGYLPIAVRRAYREASAGPLEDQD
jgi:glyoxylase-like metal-dependent hydrolase (beta-lactamase superfamily II)